MKREIAIIMPRLFQVGDLDGFAKIFDADNEFEDKNGRWESVMSF